jgi:hypothetical protein
MNKADNLIAAGVLKVPSCMVDSRCWQSAVECHRPAYAKIKTNAVASATKSQTPTTFTPFLGGNAIGRPIRRAVYIIPLIPLLPNYPSRIPTHSAISFSCYLVFRQSESFSLIGFCIVFDISVIIQHVIYTLASCRDQLMDIKKPREHTRKTRRGNY